MSLDNIIDSYHTNKHLRVRLHETIRNMDAIVIQRLVSMVADNASDETIAEYVRDGVYHAMRVVQELYDTE